MDLPPEKTTAESAVQQQNATAKKKKCFSLRKPSKWQTMLLFGELGGESAVLNKKLEAEISEAESHFAALQRNGEGSVDYEDQGDMSMYTKENLIRRNRLKSHPRMREGIDEFWDKLGSIKTTPHGVIHTTPITIITDLGKHTRMKFTDYWHLAVSNVGIKLALT